MRIKTFFANSMSEAMQDIKNHLGPEALIVQTKEIPRSGGAGVSAFEVVAAVDDANDLHVHFWDGQAGKPPDHYPAPVLRAALEGSADREHPATYSPSQMLKSQAGPLHPTAKKSKFRRSCPPAPAARPDLPFSGTLSIQLYQELVACGVHEWLACRLLAEAQEAFGPKQRRSRAALMRAIANVAQGLISPSFPQDGLPGKKVVVFVGPTGVGKTTSITKLAARLALQKHKKVILMTLDGCRIGSVEQLQIYAGLMGIPFRVLSQVADLPKAIEDQCQRDYILIDTAGRSPKEMEAKRELATFLRESPEVERHLVLSATTKDADMERIVDQFEICRPDYLLFTKLDETSSLGSILNELIRSRKPLSYYTNGQSVPQDLHTVSGGRVIDMILNEN